MLVFDHGPLGYLSIAAHGHADALSIWVHRDGIPLIVDSGTYAYGADPEARNYFRGTTAHNTLTMSGQNSSQISGPFNWSRHARCTVNSVDPKKFEISAEHDGFVGTNHRRKIMMLDDGFIVEDSLHNPVAPAPVDVRFLLAPEHDVKLSKGSAIVLSRNREIMRVSCQGPLAWAGETKGNLDRNGWYSPCMGVRIAAVQLHLSGTLSSTDVQITRFVFPPKV
jgi:uncharacterized heparinase superfamily protein